MLLVMVSAAVLAWSDEKNRWLIATRGISFDDVVEAIIEGRILDEYQHPKVDRFGHQRILIVEIGGYACAVPYVIDGDTWFLKTVCRSRELQRRHLSEQNDGQA
jgi:hypothetical protein